MQNYVIAGYPGNRFAVYTFCTL